MYIEQNCTIEHNGRVFESGGAVITDSYVVGYVASQYAKEQIGVNYTLTDWHGNKIGIIRFTSRWPTRYYISSEQFQAYATVNGVTYTGRTYGFGTSFYGKRVAKQ